MSARRLLLVAALFVSVARSAEPETEVRDAVEKLLTSSAYRWRRWDIQPSPTPYKGGGFAWRPEFTGVADHAGVCIWVAEFDGQRVFAVFAGPRSAVEVGTGWQTWLDLDRALPTDHKFAQLSIARYAFAPPADYVRLAFHGSVLFTRDGDTIRSTLTPEGAGRLIVAESRWNLHPNNGGKTDAAQGTVTWWLRDGLLQKMEIHVEGTFAPAPPGFGQMYVYRTIAHEFREQGKVQLEIAPEARAALERDATQSAERQRR